MDYNKKNFKLFAIFFIIACVLGLIAGLIHGNITDTWDLTNPFSVAFLMLSFIAVGSALISMIFLWRT